MPANQRWEARAPERKYQRRKCWRAKLGLCAEQGDGRVAGSKPQRGGRGRLQTFDFVAISRIYGHWGTPKGFKQKGCSWSQSLDSEEHRAQGPGVAGRREKALHTTTAKFRERGHEERPCSGDRAGVGRVTFTPEVCTVTPCERCRIWVKVHDSSQCFIQEV